MDRVLWLLLGLLGLTLVIALFFGGDGQVAGLDTGSFVGAMSLVAILAYLVVGRGGLRGLTGSKALTSAAIWLAVIVGLMALFTHSDSFRALLGGNF